MTETYALPSLGIRFLPMVGIRAFRASSVTMQP